MSFHKVDPTAAQLLLPYAAWTAYAAALTYKITALNGPRPRTGGDEKAE